jgi:hypothetical protein
VGELLGRLAEEQFACEVLRVRVESAEGLTSFLKEDFNRRARALKAVIGVLEGKLAMLRWEAQAQGQAQARDEEVMQRLQVRGAQADIALRRYGCTAIDNIHRATGAGECDLIFSSDPRVRRDRGPFLSGPRKRAYHPAISSSGVELSLTPRANDPPSP